MPRASTSGLLRWKTFIVRGKAMNRELLKRALEYAEELRVITQTEEGGDDIGKFIDDVKVELDKPLPEPYAYCLYEAENGGHDDLLTFDPAGKEAISLYTEPGEYFAKPVPEHLELDLLPEDPVERQQFDEIVSRLNIAPLVIVQNALTTMHKCAEYPHGSYAKVMAIYSNEIAKARALYEELLASRRHLSNEEIKQIPINAVGDKNINNFVGFPRGTLGAYLSGWRDAESYHGINEQE
jgi:hypothetical protein